MAELRELLRVAAAPPGDAPVEQITARAARLHRRTVRRQRLTFTGIASVLLLATALVLPTIVAPGQLDGVGQDTVVQPTPTRRPDPTGPAEALIGVQGPSVLGEGAVAAIDYVGEPLLLHIWASWCGVCVLQDLPTLAAYTDSPDAVRVISVAIGSDAAQAAEALEPVWPDALGLVLDDPSALDALLTDVPSWPAPLVPITIAVAPGGQVVQVQEGSATEEVYRQLGESARGGSPAESVPGPTVTFVPTEMPGATLCERPSPGPDVRVYQVQPGDSLSSIAEEVYGDPALFGVIAAANGMTGGAACPYSMLVIPPEPTTVGLPIGDLTYEVQPGDTLSIIAERVYGDPAAFGPIAQANGITDTSPLQVGQVLVIPPNPD